MTRLLEIAAALYLPHLLEEAVTGMHDDPIIAFAFASFVTLTPRHAAYLMFQAMLVVTFASTLLFAWGGRARLAFMAIVGFALVCEGHHLVRALVTFHANSGLFTSFPMPFFGAYVLYRVFRDSGATHASSPPLPS